MYTELTLGKEAMIKNEFGEKEKSIIFDTASFFCNVKSTRSSEFYQAMQNGLKVEYTVSMNKYEYYGFMDAKVYRKFVRLLHPVTQEIIEYTVTREYETNNDEIELSLTRGIENVSA